MKVQASPFRGLAAILMLALAILLALTRYPSAVRWPMLLALALAVVCIWITIRTQHQGGWAAPTLCLIVLCVFHVGAFPEFLIEGQLFGHTRYRWMSPTAGADALWITIGGILGFTAGALAASRPSEPPMGGIDTPPAYRFGPVSLTVLTISSGWWLLQTLLVGGLNPATASYSDYRDYGAGSSSTWLFQPIGLSFTLLAIAAGTRFYRIGIWVFLTFATVAFLAGFRGEVLFPLVAHLAVLAYRRRLPGAATSVTAAIGVLALSAFVKGVRSTGIAGADLSEVAASPLNGITELGFSQYVVERVVRWHYYGTDAFLGGSTYTAPLSRGFSTLLGLGTPPSSSDPRLLNVVIQKREGPIGGSVIAEAFHNFGPIGVPIVLFLLGAIISALSAGRLTDFRLAILGIATFAFMWHVRNAFVPVPLLLVGSFALVALVRLMPRSRPRRGEGRGLHFGNSRKRVV